jgi:hypothetical protein
MTAKVLLFLDKRNCLYQENATNFRLFAIKMCDFVLLFERNVVFLQRKKTRNDAD